ncbi:hypothetical protein COUCH_15230 [Couchioplanes caeruleus]|uniref:hypothetical protein n=1 Tax=Couchioplanes caeruleus TaxID=56438 RepID=UPI0020C15CD6|nr:hypothetical protein [Couchioplanes caeruleus]UQU67534.1 hypothetical protein COUCH_15230 [Couchioplanes caeruleus]
MDSSAVIASLLCLAVPAVTVCYLLTCMIWPFKVCRTCSGTGKKRAPLGRVFRLCRRCQGTGRRIRFGRHAYNVIRREHTKGTK